MKALKNSILSLLFISLSMFGLTALAQTPDGETPANEGVCDALQADGTTKGLYGLCVAFCEAQDSEAILDEATGEVTFAASSHPSNPKLLANYNKRKTATDPDMPCVIKTSACPCFTADDLNNIGHGPLQVCDSTAVRADIIGWTQGSHSPPGTPLTRQVVRAIPTNNGLECFSSYFGPEPRFNIRQVVTDDEFAACRSLIVDTCAQWPTSRPLEGLNHHCDFHEGLMHVAQ